MLVRPPGMPATADPAAEEVPLGRVGDLPWWSARWPSRENDTVARALRVHNVEFRIRATRREGHGVSHGRKGVAADAVVRDRCPAWFTTRGEEPDYRFSFANERTFLACSGTALAPLATGVAVDIVELCMSGARVLAD